MNPKRVLAGVVTLLLAIAVSPAGVTAHHRWGKYHWARSTNPLYLNIASNVNGTWSGPLAAAVSDWNDSDVLSLASTNGGRDPVACAPTLGRVDVCNAAYGDNGWLGIAQIWIGSASHIVQATTELNDTYFNTAQYNTAAWRQFVVCQEVGHTFGLDHQDERFSNTNLGTCMDYTNDPDGSVYNQLSNLSPNAHDYEELDIIYSHLDGTTGGHGRPGGAGAAPVLPDQAVGHRPGHDPSSWGRVISSNARMAVFALDFADGSTIFTFVLWA